MDICIPITLLTAITLFVAVGAVLSSPAFEIPDTTLYAKSLAQLVIFALNALAASPGSRPDRNLKGRVLHDNCSPIFAPSVIFVPPLLGFR
jgi:hypothetical protein